MPNKYLTIPGFLDEETAHLVFDKAVASLPSSGAVVVELGAWLGRSTAYLAEAMLEAGKKEFKLYSVDNWLCENISDKAKAGLPTNYYEQYLANLERVGLTKEVFPVKLDSIEMASRFADETVDFAYIDDMHTYEHVVAEIRVWLPKMKKGSVLCGDDMYDPGVQRAVYAHFPADKVFITPNQRAWSVEV
jgi:predicted O-methyltransferase YrrM